MFADLPEFQEVYKFSSSTTVFSLLAASSQVLLENVRSATVRAFEETEAVNLLEGSAARIAIRFDLLHTLTSFVVTTDLRAAM